MTPVPIDLDRLDTGGLVAERQHTLSAEGED